MQIKSELFYDTKEEIMENIETIHDRITQLVNAFGDGKNTVFASVIGTNEANVRGYRSGTMPKYDFLEKIAINLDINLDWLLTGRGEMCKARNSKDFTKDSSYAAIFNRLFEDSISHTDLTFEDFGEYCGISRTRMKAIYLRNSEMTPAEIGLIATKLGLNLEWVINGSGDQFISKEYSFDAFKLKYNEFKQKHAAQAIPATCPGEGIPLIPTSAMAGFFSGEQQVLEYECERFVVPTFKGAEFLISVKGSSMYPKYNSGDIVACKRLPLKDLFFQWNKVYVLDTDQGPLIKRVQQGSDDEHIMIVSDNEKYAPFELSLQHIYNVALVIGVIRLE